MIFVLGFRSTYKGQFTQLCQHNIQEFTFVIKILYFSLREGKGVPRLVREMNALGM